MLINLRDDFEMIDTVGEREGKSWRTKISRLIYYRVSRY